MPAGYRGGGGVVGDVIVSGFDPRTVDKVERLLDLLEEMNAHPDLHGKLAMHGGTAINLFMLDVPRLSVDIDVSYIGTVGRDEMLAERPAIERGIEEVARYLGYDVPPTKSEHAGRTFMLRYLGDRGPDHVKVDCVFLNRSPLTAPIMRACAIRPEAEVLMFCDHELAGGKVKAFFDRVKVRDLYDVSNLGRLLEAASEEEELRAHRAMLYYASLSARFPQPLEGRSERFAGRDDEVASQLVPMLRKADEQPTLEQLIDEAEEFIRKRILPRTDDEAEYLRRFADGDYRPELLFPDENMADAARKSPAALWKLRNLNKMPREES